MGGENIEFRDEICFSFALSPFPPLTLASSCPSEKVARKHGRKRAKDGLMDGWIKKMMTLIFVYQNYLLTPNVRLSTCIHSFFHLTKIY